MIYISLIVLDAHSIDPVIIHEIPFIQININLPKTVNLRLHPFQNFGHCLQILPDFKAPPCNPYQAIIFTSLIFITSFCFYQLFSSNYRVMNVEKCCFSLFQKH